VPNGTVPPVVAWRHDRHTWRRHAE